MSRPSSITQLPPYIRQEVDRRLFVEHWTQLAVTNWLTRQGYKTSKSSLNRYVKAVAKGREELHQLRVGRSTLPDLVAGMLAGSDEKLATLIGDVITHVVRLSAAADRLQSHLRDQHRTATVKAEAVAWAKEQRDD